MVGEKGDLLPNLRSETCRQMHYPMFLIHCGNNAPATISRRAISLQSHVSRNHVATKNFGPGIDDCSIRCRAADYCCQNGERNLLLRIDAHLRRLAIKKYVGSRPY